MPAERDALHAFAARIDPRGSADDARRRGDRLRRRRRALTTIGACAVVLAIVGGVTAIADRVTEDSQTHIIDNAPSDVTDRPGWTQLADVPLSPRERPAIAWTGSEIVVWGGVNGSEVMRDGAAYDPHADTWRRLPAPPTELTGAPVHAVATENEVVLITHDDRTDATQAVAYDPSGDSWRTLASPPVDVSNNLSSGWTGNEVLIYSPYVGDAVGREPVRIAYSPEQDAWRALPDLPFVPNSGPRVFLLGRSLVVVDGAEQSPDDPGGAPGGGPYRAAVYEPESESWQDLPPHDLVGRPIPWPIDDGRALFLSQGCEDVWCHEGLLLDANAQTWEPVDISPLAPTSDPNHYPFMVVERTRDELLFWGMGHGVAFSPSTLSWRPLSPAPVQGLEAQWGRSVQVDERVLRVSVALSNDNPTVRLWQYLPEESPTSGPPAGTDPARVMWAMDKAHMVARFGHVPVDEVMGGLSSIQEFSLRSAEIELAIGAEATRTITFDDLPHPASWEVPLPDGDGAVSIVELLQSADELLITFDRSTTCAAQVAPDPPGTDGALRISIVGSRASDCGDWFAIDIFAEAIQPMVIRLDLPE